MKEWIVWDNYNKTFQRKVGTLTDPKHNTWYLMRVNTETTDDLIKARFKVVQKTKEKC